MLKRYLFVFILFVSSFSINAQDFSALWEGHFSYFNIIDITKSDSKIYAASENVVFSYDINTNEISTITTVEGLSGDFITTIEYSLDNQLLLIGYQTGLIEIYFESDEQVLSVVDILDKVSIAPSLRVINDFNEHEGLVYISTDFGISVYDLERLEFGDTYFIGNNGAQIPVEKTTVFNDAIYAACTNNAGVRKGVLSNPNLVDFQQWNTITSGNFTSIEQSEGRLYALGINRVLSEVVGDVLSQRLTFSTLPLDSDVTDNRLVYTTPSNVFIYNSNAVLTNQINQTEVFTTDYSSAITFNSEIYIGTTTFGVLKTDVIDLQTFTEIRPEGPLRNDPFRIEAFNDGVWVTYGEYTPTLNPFPLTSRGISRLIGDEWLSKPFDSLLSTRELNDININPFNTNQVFISSFSDGLLELNDFEATLLFNQTNSPLQSLILPGNPNFINIRVGASVFDEQGKLWTTTSRVDLALKSYDPVNGQWQTFSFSDVIENALSDELGFSDIVIDNNQTKWIGAFNSGLIAYNSSENPTIKNINSEEAGFESRTIYALALDNSNRLWIGTDRGLRVLFNTSGFFEDDSPRVEPIIFLEDGLPRELLEGQLITDIKVDGSNSKWVGTADSGVFYINPNGQNTIFHFTKDNSPLPSNTISDISINPSNGTVFFATDRGLLSFKSGGSSVQERLEQAYVFPNPVRPEYNILGSNDLNDINKGVKIKGLTENVNVKITDVEGNLVAEAQSRVTRRNSNLNFNFAIDGGTGIWNGKNLANNIVASGVYLIFISDLDSFETKVLKLLIVR